jgi:polyhydroxyalkanoate synthesis regulator phasin
MLQSQMFNIGLNAEKEKRNISELIYQIKEEICDYVEDIEKKMSDNLTKLSKDLFATNESVDTIKIDSSGVLKELQAYKKSMLILEKKIEHIYTLIDRSKRGGLLAKPEH